MDYLKIVEVAHKCEVKKAQINEHYRMLGANRQFDDETKEVFYSVIEDIKKEVVSLENKLRKLTT